MDLAQFGDLECYDDIHRTSISLKFSHISLKSEQPIYCLNASGYASNG